jgi:hypothetical protein
VVEILRDYFVRSKLERTDIPSEHVRGQFSFNMPEEERDANPPETDAAIKRIPPGDL